MDFFRGMVLFVFTRWQEMNCCDIWKNWARTMNPELLSCGVMLSSETQLFITPAPEHIQYSGLYSTLPYRYA